MANDITAIEQQLNEMLPHIINDALVGPYVSMGRMCDIVAARNSFRGVRYDDTSLFPEELISHFRSAGHAVDNAHRITLTLGNVSSLSLQMLLEAPGDSALVRYRLRYTDGTIEAESVIGYGSRALTAERFDDMAENFRLHSGRLRPKLDRLSRDLMRRRMERRIFEQALPIYVDAAAPSYGYPYSLSFNARDYRDGALLHLRLGRLRHISFRLTMDSFETQLQNIPRCMPSIDSGLDILTEMQLNTHAMQVKEWRAMLGPAERDEVSLSHFVRQSKLILKDTVGGGCFLICYLTGNSAEMYLLLRDRLWLKWYISSRDYKDEISEGLNLRTSLMRLMDSTQLTFTIGEIDCAYRWINPHDNEKTN